MMEERGTEQSWICINAVVALYKIRLYSRRSHEPSKRYSGTIINDAIENQDIKLCYKPYSAEAVQRKSSCMWQVVMQSCAETWPHANTIGGANHFQVNDLSPRAR